MGLTVGDFVLMPAPTGADMWQQACAGVVTSIDSIYAIVVDQEDDAFTIEVDRLEAENKETE
jgi:hypothetical protein